MKKILSKLWLLPLLLLVILILGVITEDTPDIGTGIVILFIFWATIPVLWISSLLRFLYLLLAKKGLSKKIIIVFAITTTLLTLQGIGLWYWVNIKHSGNTSLDALSTSQAINKANQYFGAKKPAYTPEGYEITTANIVGVSVVDNLTINYVGPKYTQKTQSSRGENYTSLSDSYEISQYKIYPGMESAPCTITPLTTERVEKQPACVQEGDIHYVIYLGNKTYYSTSGNRRIAFQSYSYRDQDIPLDAIKKIIQSVY